MDCTSLIAHAVVGTFVLLFLELGHLHLQYKSGIEVRKARKSKSGEDVDPSILRTSLNKSKK